MKGLSFGVDDALRAEVERLMQRDDDDDDGSDYESGDDDSEYGDDGDDENDDFATALLHGFSLAFTAKGRTEHSAEKKIAATNISMKRESIDIAVGALPADNGVVKVVAEPASGKTSVFPEKVKDRFDADVCVVTHSTAALASVVANKSVAWIDKEMSMHATDPGPVYMTSEVFDNIHLRDAFDLEQKDPVGSKLREDTIVMFDEAQINGAWGAKVDAYSGIYASTNRVIQLHGNYADKNIKIPTEAKVMPSKAFDIAKEDRVLWLHRCTKDAIRAQRSDLGARSFRVSESDSDGYIQVLKQCLLLEKFIIHATPADVIGLDIPNLTCVVGVGSYKQNDSICTLSFTDHVQCMTRAGRRGGSFSYYFDKPLKDLRPSSETARTDTDVDKFISLVKRARGTEVKFSLHLGPKRRRKRRDHASDTSVSSGKHSDDEKPLLVVEPSANKIGDIKTPRNEVPDGGPNQLSEAIDINRKQLQGVFDDKIVLSGGSKLLAIEQLACLPTTFANTDFSFYPVEVICQRSTANHDVSNLLYHNFDYIVHSARRYVTTNPNGLDDPGKDLPRFYKIYTDMLAWLNRRKNKCYRLRPRSFTYVKNGKMTNFVPTAIPFAMDNRS